MRFHIWFIFLILFSCQKDQKNKSNGKTVNYQLIDLGNSLKFNWDLDKTSIVKDQLYEQTKKVYQNQKNILVHKIMDTSSTDVIFCNTLKTFKKGDLAFVLIDEIEGINYFTDLNIQMDTFTFGCSYPEDLLVVLNNRRIHISDAIYSIVN